MAQQKLSGNGGEADSEQSSSEDSFESYDYIKYLDVDRLKFIKGLATTLHTVSEVEKFLQAEQQRWNRDNVVRILEARKEALETSSSNGHRVTDRVFRYTGQCASS